MRLLANENFPMQSVLILRKQKIDIVSIAKFSPGISDINVLQLAIKEVRIILTFDRDYGELIYKRGLQKPVGLIYFRIVPCTPTEPADILLEILKRAEIKISGFFTVVERDQIRQRRI